MSAFLAAQPNRNWVSVGVFPVALEKRDSAEERTNHAIRSLSQLGLGNLRYLTERWQLMRSDDDSQDQLARIICAGHSDTVFYLREFHRPKIPIVEEVYDAEFTERERKQIEASVEHLSTSLRSLAVSLSCFCFTRKMLNCFTISICSRFGVPGPLLLSIKWRTSGLEDS